MKAAKKPLVYHYTTMDRLDDILAVDELRLTDPKAVRLDSDPHPMLWFSRNPVWEQSVIKDRRDEGRRQYPPPGRAITELHGRGLIRFGAPASVAKLRWDDYLARNNKPFIERELMARMGTPADWLATDQPVPLGACRGIQVWYRGAWVRLPPPADFEAYIDGRTAVYAAALDRLAEKIEKANDTGATSLRVDDDAEAILYDDLMAWARLDEWKQEHLGEIREWQIRERLWGKVK